MASVGALPLSEQINASLKVLQDGKVVTGEGVEGGDVAIKCPLCGAMFDMTTGKPFPFNRTSS